MDICVAHIIQKMSICLDDLHPEHPFSFSLFCYATTSFVAENKFTYNRDK